jgi:hypothetical protein
MPYTARTQNWTTERRRYYPDGLIFDPATQMFIGNPYRNGTGDYGIGWRDLVGQVQTFRAAGAGVPTFTQIGSTGFFFWKFAVGDSVVAIYHIDHDFAYGTKIFFHTHWFKDGTNVQPVKWEMKVAYAHGHAQGVFDFTNPTTDTVTTTPAATAYTHQVSELATGIDLSYRTDGIVSVIYKRVANGGTDNTDGVYLITADCHYQTDKFATLNKGPDANGSFQSYV